MMEFFVPGVPRPAGSKRHVGHGILVDSSGAKGKQWRAVVQLAARAAHVGTALTGPLSVRMFFIVARPKGHYTTRGVKPSAPRFPAVRPDVLKLARAVEDACTGILWQDDAQIVEEELAKGYGDEIGVRIRVKEL